MNNWAENECPHEMGYNWEYYNYHYDEWLYAGQSLTINCLSRSERKFEKFMF